MKKVLLMCLVVALTLGTAFTAVANEVDCDDCKYIPPEIPCKDVQGGCFPQPINWQQFVFPICDCENSAANFAKGKQIGVQMDILTPGVYWAEPDFSLEIVAYKSFKDACDRKNSQSLMTNQMGLVSQAEFSSVYYYPDATCDAAKAWKPGSQGEIDHDLCSWTDIFNYPKFKSVRTNTQDPNAFFKIPDNRRKDAAGNPVVPTETIATIPEWDGYTYWTVRIPDIKIDTAEVLAAGLRGEPIQIRIQMLSAGSGGICTTCNVLCECIIEVAIICDQEMGCVMFPYVVTGSDTWSTGIAITNIGDIPAEEMEATFSITDKSGNTFSYVKKGFESIHWADVMDEEMLENFDGMPAAGGSMLKIETNFYVDGYQFITDGVFGGSTNARTWWEACPTNRTGWNHNSDVMQKNNYMHMDIYNMQDSIYQLQNSVDQLLNEDPPEE